MYAYVTLFTELVLEQEKVILRGAVAQSVLRGFADQLAAIQGGLCGCIALFAGQSNREKPAVVLTVSQLTVASDTITLTFTVGETLDIESGLLGRGLYGAARRNGWIKKEDRFCPVLCLMDKSEFDVIRKGVRNWTKISSYAAQLDEMQQACDWQGICSLYGPLEELSQVEDVWGNPGALYQVAYACSKLGELQNGQERNKQHLADIKYYREASVRLYHRCHELEPDNFRYPSALGYRYRQNVMELKRPRGRRDGNAHEEMQAALVWLDKALALKPSCIKDHYRKASLLLDYYIPHLQYGKYVAGLSIREEIKQMTEAAVKHLEAAISLYQSLSDKVEQQREHGIYVKALYALGCHYLSVYKPDWNAYACHQIWHPEKSYSIQRNRLAAISLARDYLHACWAAECEYTPAERMSSKELALHSTGWKVDISDKLYRLGTVYLTMYMVKVCCEGETEKSMSYKASAERMLGQAYEVGEQRRKLRLTKRNMNFILEKLAWLYIVSGEYDKAVELLEGKQDSYIKHTYAVAVVLTRRLCQYEKAEALLREVANDCYYKGREVALVILAHVYRLTGKNKEAEAICQQAHSFSTRAKTLLNMLAGGEASQCG